MKLKFEILMGLIFDKCQYLPDFVEKLITSQKKYLTNLLKSKNTTD